MPDGPWMDYAPAPDGPWSDFAKPQPFDPAQPYPKATAEPPITTVDDYGRPVGRTLPEVDTNQPLPRGNMGDGRPYQGGMDFNLPGGPRTFTPDGIRVPGQTYNRALGAAGLQGGASGVAAIVRAPGEFAPVAAAAEDTLRGIALIDQDKAGPEMYQGMSNIARGQVANYIRATPEQRVQIKADLTAQAAQAGQPNAMTRAGDAIDAAAQREFAVDQGQEGFGTKAMRMFGSAVPALGAGMVAGPAAGLAVFGLQAYDGTTKEATQKGATPRQAAQAATVSSLASMGIFALPFGQAARSVVPELSSGVLQAILEAGAKSAEFSVASATAKAVDNAVAQRAYNPDQPLMEGVLEAGLAGAGMGAVFGAPGVARAVHAAANDARLPLNDPGLHGAYTTQQNEAAAAQRLIGTDQPPGTPPEASAPVAPVAPKPTPPVAPTGQEVAPIAAPTPPITTPAPPPVVPPEAPRPPIAAPAPPVAAPPNPHQVLANISQGKPPETPVAAPPTPAPPVAAPVAATPPPVATPPVPPRSPGQIQRDEGIGYNPAREKALAEGWTPPAPPPPAAPPQESKPPASVESPPPAVPPQESTPAPVESKPAASPSPFEMQPIGSRQAPANGYSGPLSDHTPVVFREAAPAEAKFFLPGRAATDMNTSEPFFSDNPATALGQGDNKDGIQLAFDTANLRGVVSRTKPAWQFMYENGAAEYVGRHNTQAAYQGALAGVRVPNGIDLSRGDGNQVRFGLQELQRRGWTKQDLGNGYTEFLPGEAREGVLPAAITQNPAPESAITPGTIAQEPAKPALVAPPNALISDDRMAQIRERLRQKAAEASSGIDPNAPGTSLAVRMDPELMQLGAELAVGYVERGVVSFPAYANEMIAAVGEDYRPFLRMWYEGARYYPGADASGMSPHAEIEAHVAQWATQDGGQERPDGTQGSVPATDVAAGAEGVHGTAPVGPTGEPRPASDDAGAPDAGGNTGVSTEGSAGQPDHAGGAGSGGIRPGGVPGVPEPTPGATGRPARPDATVQGSNFVIAPGAVEEARGRAQKARDNVEAIRLAKRLIAEDRPATRAEQSILVKYVGWGGLSGAFPDSAGNLGKGLEKVGAELRTLLTPEEHKTAAQSTQYAHYTAEHVIRSMWDAVQQMGFEGGSVFEPGMGVGHFLGMAPPDLAANMRYQGVEMDHLTASIAKLLYPESGVRQADFTAMPLPEKAFDLVIGNPPFSDTVIRSDQKYRARRFMLHDYFFAKSLDAVRPGGLLGFVTSAGTMNKLDSKAREYLAERADFIGGVRLPSNAFKQNAGTEVTTDILFFRRRLDAKVTLPSMPAWTETVQRELPNAQGQTQSGNVNRYFSDNPAMVLGREGFFDKLYKDRYAVHNFDNGDLPANLRAAIDRLPRDVMQHEPTPEQKAALDFASGQTKDGSYYLSPTGMLMQYRGGAGQAVGRRGIEGGGLTQAEQARVRQLIPLRDALRDVFRHDLLENTDEAAAARARLNAAYDRFVKEFGPINKAEFTYRRPTLVQQETARAEAREEARSAGMPWNEGSFIIGPLLQKATTTGLAKERQKLREQYQAQGRRFDEGAFDPSALPDIVLEKRPNIAPFMADPESYRLRSIENYNADTGVAAKKDIFHHNILTKEREPEINSANDGVLWSMNSFGKFDVDKIAAKMGRDKASIITELGDKVFKVPGTGDTYQTSDEYLSGDVVTKLEQARAAAANDPDVRRNVSALEAAVPPPLAPSEIVITLGMPWIPREVVQAFVRDHLQLGDFPIQHAPGIGTWTMDTGNLRGNPPGFDQWNLPGVRDPYELLRDALNRTPPRIYQTVRNPDGSKSQVFDAVGTQAAQDRVNAIKAAFAGFVHDDNTRADGLAALYNGKLNRNVLRQYDGSYMTTPGIAAAWSWRPHQTRVVARIVQDGNTYMAHAVGAGKTSAMIGAGMEMRRLGLVKKPMYVVPNHMLGQFTKEFYEQYPTARIAVADEDRFHKDVRKQFMANIAQDDLDAVIITHSSFGFMPVSLEFQAGLIEEQIDMLRESLDQLDKGQDRITIKKIENAIEKLRQKLSGQGVGRTDQTITFEESGVDFLFIDEAHEFRKLALATKQGQMKGISSDGSDKAWDLYTKTRYLDQQKPGRSLVMASGTPITNTMGELYSLSRFIQPDALASRGIGHFDSWAQTFGDTKTQLEETAAGTYKPVTRFGSFVNLPELYKMVGAQMDIVTPKQLEQYVVRPQLQGGQRQFHLAPRTPLLDAYQASLGARMEAIAARKGPPQKGDDIMLSVINDGRHSAIDPRFIADTASDPESKLNLMLANVARIYHASTEQEFFDPKDGYKTSLGQGPAAQMIFANLGVNPRGPADFSGYRWMKQALIAHGVRPGEIAYIGDHDGTVQRQKLFNDVNEGRIRVLIGSTQKMGTGVNAQRRLIALHNQDPLWYPADDEQRVGRLIRQGNTNPEVQVHDYSTKGTYDSAMWKMMGNKARFIEQFFRGDPTLRSMEDIGEASMYEQASAMATTDERMITLTQMRQDLDQAQRREQAFDRDQYQIRNNITLQQSGARFYAERAADTQTDIDRRFDTRGDAFQMSVGTQPLGKRAEAAEALQAAATNAMNGLKQNQSVQIANIGAFPLFVRRTFGDAMALYLKTAGLDQRIDLEGHNFAGIIASAESKLRNLEHTLAYYNENVAKAHARAASLQEQINPSFPGRADVIRLTKAVADFEAALKADPTGAIGKNPAIAEEDDPVRGDDSQYAVRKSAKAKQPTATPDQAAIEARDTLYQSAAGMMRFIGLPEAVALRLVDSLPVKGVGQADAMYQSDKALITYALNTDPQLAPVKLWHEAVHALLDPKLGLLNEAQRRALFTGADRWLYDGKRGVHRRLELRMLGYAPEKMRDEAIARMAEDALQRGQLPRTLTGIAIERMQNFSRGIGQVLRGQGYHTAEDVFRALQTGQQALPGSREQMAEATQRSLARGQPTAPATQAAPPAQTTPVDKRASQQTPTAEAKRQQLDQEFPPEGTPRSLNDVLGDQADEQYAIRPTKSLRPLGTPFSLRQEIQQRVQTTKATALKVVDDIQKVFSPTSRGAAKEMEHLIRGRAALQAQSAAQTGHALEKFRHTVGRLSEAAQLDITNRMERGLPQATPALQEVASAIRGQLDHWTARLQSLGKLEDAQEFYMGRIYANHTEWAANQQAPQNIQAVGLSSAIGAGIGKRPLRGSGNFLKPRSFEYLSDGIAAGLIPVTTNPIEMQTLKLREMQRYYHGSKLAEQIKDTGMARWVPNEGYGRATQLGLKELDDKVFKPKRPAEGHGLIEDGKWMAPGMLADIFNNYVSQGLSGRSTIYDMVRQSGNALNSAQLSLSGFHATFIALDSMTSRVALGLQQISRGDAGRGLVNTALGISPHSIATTIARGSKLRSAYLDPQNATPQWRKLAALLNSGGGRINMDQFYRSSASGSFFKGLNDLKNPDGAFREAWQMVRDTPLTSPFRLMARVMDTLLEPLMGQMVPRAKLGVFADLAADWQRRNPNASPGETSAAMTKFWDSVDNRMGQMVYDNLFWHKALKDIAFVSTRSVGWNLGTIRELGGAAVDTAAQVGRMAQGRAPELTTRMAYAMAMPLIAAVFGAILTYLFTGEGPKQLLDYFYPCAKRDETGACTARLQMPGYIKDVIAYTHAPLQTLANKSNPLLSMAFQVAKNEDYYGGSIYDPARDPSETSAYLEYLINQTAPFSLRSQQKLAGQGAGMLEQSLAFWGIQPAPASITDPERGEAFQARHDAAAFKKRAREPDRIRLQ